MILDLIINSIVFNFFRYNKKDALEHTKIVLTKTMRPIVEIRNFTKFDFPSVRTIYEQGIKTGDATFQEKTKDWDDWNSSFLASCRLVAVSNKNVVGWAALSLVSTRSVYSGVAEVSVYVAQHERGTGVGHSLIRKLVFSAEHEGLWTLQASILPENKASIAIHLKNGFKQIGIREKLGKLNCVWRDVALLERRSKIIGAEK